VCAMRRAHMHPSEAHWTGDDRHDGIAIRTAAVVGSRRGAACRTLQDTRLELGARNCESRAATTSHTGPHAPAAQIVANATTGAFGDHIEA
jgi:hypothetical protein